MSGSVVTSPLVRSVHRSISQLICETDNGPKVVALEPVSTTEPLDFTNYEGRLKSFVNWPNKDIAKEVLAKAGFFYKNCNDIVECPFCHIEGYQWVAGDNPMEDHRSWSPHCPFVMNSFEQNSPTNNASRNVDTCGLYGVEILPNSVPEDEKEIHLEKLGIQKNKGPAYPEKFSFDSRLKTFSVWPKSIKQTPHNLAEAGFFYVGVGDQTLCFHCGGGLKDWEENDDPWEEHALWFPKCTYLFLKKGPDYIEQVKQKKDPKAPIAETNPCSSKTKENSESEQLSVTSEVTESKERDEKTLCKICYKNEVGVVFLPCGHIVACVECSAALKTCAVCRKPLEATVRAFLS